MSPELPASNLRHVEAADVSLAYQVFGEGSGKRPLVFIHGYSMRSTGELYAPLYRYLAEAFTIYALDTRGHGASAHLVDNWSFATMADDLATAVRRLGLVKPVHAGHSYGGFLGLVTELYHPGTFSALNLLAPAAASGGGATPDEVKKNVTNNGRRREIMRSMYEGMYVRTPEERHLEEALDAVTLLDLKVHETYFWTEYPSINIMDRLGELKLPVLSVTGGRDIIVSPEEQRATSAALPNSKEVSFSDEGHMIPFENPSRVAREVLRFVNDTFSPNHEYRPAASPPATTRPPHPSSASSTWPPHACG